MPSKRELLRRERRRTGRDYLATVDAAVAEHRALTDEEQSRQHALRARLDELDERLRVEEWQGFLRHSEYPCRAFRLQAGDVLIFETDGELSAGARERLEASVRTFGERLGLTIEALVLEDGLRLVCSRESESPTPEDARPR